MATELIFDRVIESNDGADNNVVFEIAVTIEQLMEAVESGDLEVGNIRPDHEVVTTKRGERFKRRSVRQRTWTEKLSQGRGVMGNLSWNIDPDHHEIIYDQGAGKYIRAPACGRRDQYQNPRLGYPAPGDDGC